MDVQPVTATEAVRILAATCPESRMGKSVMRGKPDFERVMELEFYRVGRSVFAADLADGRKAWILVGSRGTILLRRGGPLPSDTTRFPSKTGS